MEIVACLELADSQVVHHLTPVALHPAVKKVWIVRSRQPGCGDIPSAEYVLASARWKPLRLLQMFWHCLRLARRRDVRLFVSFNPLPYGFIGAAAARIYNKPFHLGFIGSDWNRDISKRRGRWLLPFVRHAWLVSAPGMNMIREIEQRGVARARLTVLPHCLDISRFPVGDPSQCDYDCLFVGRLIRLKQVDVVLRAFQKILSVRPETRLAIVGDGPMRDDLQRLAMKLRIAGQVDFVGYVAQVSPYFARSRVLVMASQHEGMPYALIEAVCSGVVPVCTPVGEISSVVRSECNGYLHCGNVQELAAILLRLLEDEELYRRLRKNALASRDDFSYAAATNAWAPWLEQLAVARCGENSA